MLAKRYALINADGVVVNCIVGALTPQQEQMILAAENSINGATQILGVEADTAMWIGGSYTDGAFIAPPAPEPLPEPLPEVITEPEI
ncbi:hypothetical protein UFOVP461_10 [uncultured Caudovirales phage]|uniref:Uncharacterized protein n=1 Tax=uncultured Caudovirales phage TaxID=2100421 RepID=A0A6J5MDY7_9CAUD|nr:hypothetical protein UFOVP461_10 [uncultured Caudovirales phage]CAB4189308.1 hypothetical protein UFOVP1185_30 [uncultured Caudovirales phage]